MFGSELYFLTAARRPPVLTKLQVGPEVCPLAKKNGEDPSRIKDRIEAFVDGLYYQPLPSPFAGTPGVLTSGRARSMYSERSFITATYAP